MSTLILIRGIPGSGKTTLAKKLAAQIGAMHYEADDFFIVDGEYKFNPKYLKEAHQHCFVHVREALKWAPSVIAANTFTQAWEIQTYLELVKKVGVSTRIIHCLGNYGSIHNVPAEKIEQMSARFITNDALQRRFEIEFPNVSYETCLFTKV
jgi:predicted kinase